ncbi:formamidopyrimidine-DNA glycosylase [Candidatus Rubidus massiliensis]|nr:formamidopyrimidine-DNA glycosylase [Candidatus Rubidus massiliensis]
MPELPEVETIVQDLLISHILNKPIKNITINFDKIIGNTKPELFTKALFGQSISL